MKSAASSTVKRRSAARTSVSCPRARNRGRASAGSARVLITSRSWVGRWLRRKLIPGWTPGPSARGESSSTRGTSPGSTLSSLSSPPRSCSVGCCPASSSARAPAPTPGTARSRAATTYAQKVVASWSPSSRETQAMAREASGSANQLRRSAVFPNPAGAERRVSLPPSPARRSLNRGRGTAPARAGGRNSLVSTKGPGITAPGAPSTRWARLAPAWSPAHCTACFPVTATTVVARPGPRPPPVLSKGVPGVGCCPCATTGASPRDVGSAMGHPRQSGHAASSDGHQGGGNTSGPGSLSHGSDPPLAAIAEPQRVRWGFIGLYMLAYTGTSLLFLAPLLVSLALKVDGLVGIEAAPSRLALVTSVGALLSIVANPFFGRLSDRTTSRWGMRRPWMVIGLVGGSAGIVTVALAPDIAVVLVGWCAAQVFFNALLAAMAAVLPDQVPTAQRGAVSGSLAVCLPVASVLGTFLVQAFDQSTLTMLLVPCAVGGVFVLMFVARLTDRRLEPGHAPVWSIRELLGTFY